MQLFWFVDLKLSWSVGLELSEHLWIQHLHRENTINDIKD